MPWVKLSFLLFLSSVTADNWVWSSIEAVKNATGAYQDHVKKQLERYGEEYGVSWVVMPDGNGHAHFGLLRGNYWFDVKKLELIRYYFHSRDYPSGTLVTSLEDLKFDVNKPVKIVIHGWMSGAEHESSFVIQKAYTQYMDVNLFLVDWAPIAKDAVYSRVAHATNWVGIAVGTFIDDLVKFTGVEYHNIHVIGHSLGGHVASAAGKFVKEKIGRITGLDPAGPCFMGFEPCFVRNNLTKIYATDAHFVDVIHSCSGVAGLPQPLGHVDFYPNGGSPKQPGCDEFNYILQEQSCSHARAPRYFAESIESPYFMAVGCNSWGEFILGCDNVTTQLMGEDATREPEGVFFLKTSSTPPYSLGLDGTKYNI